jgi:Icc-related predicted phosphoesterase
MKLIALPDLHEMGIKHLPAIAEPLATADLVVLVGDLTNIGGAPEIDLVVGAIRAYNSSILAIPGNWDGNAANARLTELGINLHRTHGIRSGFALLGVGGSLISFGQTPNEYSESAFTTLLAKAAEGLDPNLPIILISHQPPINTIVDKAWGDLHLGSLSIREFIEAHEPMLCLTGHIHEGVGIDRIGKSHILNPGPLWQGHYGYVELDTTGIQAIEIRKIALDSSFSLLT